MSPDIQTLVASSDAVHEDSKGRAGLPAGLRSRLALNFVAPSFRRIVRAIVRRCGVGTLRTIVGIRSGYLGLRYAAFRR